MAKVEILHIWNNDGDRWISAHATENQRDLRLYDFAVDRWNEYEDLPDPDDLSQAEAIEAWFEVASDHYGYSFFSSVIPQLKEGDAEPEDATFLTEKELSFLSGALYIANPLTLGAQADPSMEVEEVKEMVAHLLEKLKL